MSSKTINARIKQKRDTDSNWQSKNPTLLDGEIILVDMSNGELRAKIGNGTSKYIQLPFSDESLRNLINAVEIKVDGVQDLVGDTSVSDQISDAITEHTHPVDSALSSTSTNPVQNKVVFGAVQALIDGMGDEPVADQIEEAITTHNHDDRYYTEPEIDTKLSTKSNTGHIHSTYVNQNAFSNVTVGSTTIAADTTTDTLTLVAGSNVTLTPDAANDKITIAATDTVYTHPSYTARTGKPTANQTPAFGGTATVSQITSDATGHVTGATDRTITIPSTLSNGSGTAGLIKTSSTVTSSSGYTACPVISGVPYYKDTDTTYSLSSFGVTATAAELNYMDGVTANVQTQLNEKSPSSHTHYIQSGTWTPVLDGITSYVNQSGRWYRFGNFVTLLFEIRVSKSNSGAASSTAISISGFADACGSIGENAAGNGLFNAGGLNGGSFAGYYGASGATSFGPRMINSDGSLSTVTFGSNVLTMIYGSFTYYSPVKSSESSTSTPLA